MGTKNIDLMLTTTNIDPSTPIIHTGIILLTRQKYIVKLTLLISFLMTVEAEFLLYYSLE